MAGLPLLTAVTFVPLIGALFVFAVRRSSGQILVGRGDGRRREQLRASMSVARASERDGYGQLDATVNWNVTDKFVLSFNGINLNEEARYQYFLTPDRMLAHRASGSRYAVTARIRF